MRLHLALTAIALFVLWGTASAQPREALETAQKLMQRSGMAEQLKSLPQQFEPELALARGTLPDEVLAALGEATRQSFVPQTIEEDITRLIAARLSVADMKGALGWLDGAAGRRVTRAEVLASSTLTPQVLEAHAATLERKPPAQKRAKLIADLVVATRGIEQTVNLVEGVTLGIAMGVDATKPVQNRQGLQALQAKLRAGMPPEALRKAMAAEVPKLYLWMYRELSDEDLAAYLEFNRTALGTRYTDAMIAAFTEAMLRASMRMGPAIEKALKKRRA